MEGYNFKFSTELRINEWLLKFRITDGIKTDAFEFKNCPNLRQKFFYCSTQNINSNDIFLERITEIAWKFIFKRWYIFSIVFNIAKVNPDGFCKKNFLLIILPIEVYSQFFVLNLLRTIKIITIDQEGQVNWNETLVLKSHLYEEAENCTEKLPHIEICEIKKFIIKKCNLVLCISKICEEEMHEFQFACFFYIFEIKASLYDAKLTAFNYWITSRRARWRS